MHLCAGILIGSFGLCADAAEKDQQEMRDFHCDSFLNEHRERERESFELAKTLKKSEPHCFEN